MSDQTMETELVQAFAVLHTKSTNEHETREFKRLLPLLAEIRKKNEIVGYILKNSTHAKADVNKPEELSDLSILATTIFESSRTLLKSCKFGGMKTAVLEGSKMRVLCLNAYGNHVSIFMDRSVDCGRILEQLSQTGK